MITAITKAWMSQKSKYYVTILLSWMFMSTQTRKGLTTSSYSSSLATDQLYTLFNIKLLEVKEIHYSFSLWND